MKLYESYAKFYDSTQNSGMYNVYSKLIEKYAPHSRTLLELGCGTGLNLERFREKYEVTGIDYSEAMLGHAIKRLPQIPLFHQDMSKLSLKGYFDAIVCPYDSINHVLDFDSWVNTFQRAKEHLAPGGVFIFDFNTLFKLEQLAEGAEFVNRFENNYLIIDVQKTSELSFDWDIKIFEKQGDSSYELHAEVIQEVSYDLIKIKEALESIFDSVTLFGGCLKNEPIANSGRVFCICR